MRIALPILIATTALVCIASAQRVPTDTWKTIDGNQISPAVIAQRGPTLITFWALWCAPCKREMRALKLLQEKYAGQGFSVIAVNTDSPRSLAKVRAYVSANELPFFIVADPNGHLLERFNVPALPQGFLYDRSGSLSYTSAGYKPGDEKPLEEAIRKILGNR